MRSKSVSKEGIGPHPSVRPVPGSSYHCLPAGDRGSADILRSADGGVDLQYHLAELLSRLEVSEGLSASLQGIEPVDRRLDPSSTHETEHFGHVCMGSHGRADQ